VTLHNDNATIDGSLTDWAAALVAKQQMDGDLLGPIRAAVQKGGGLSNASDQTETSITRGQE
jgi:hypothetical protein